MQQLLVRARLGYGLGITRPYVPRVHMHVRSLRAGASPSPSHGRPPALAPRFSLAAWPSMVEGHGRDAAVACASILTESQRGLRGVAASKVRKNPCSRRPRAEATGGRRRAAKADGRG